MIINSQFSFNVQGMLFIILSVNCVCVCMFKISLKIWFLSYESNLFILVSNWGALINPPPLQGLSNKGRDTRCQMGFQSGFILGGLIALRNAMSCRRQLQPKTKMGGISFLLLKSLVQLGLQYNLQGHDEQASWRIRVLHNTGHMMSGEAFKLTRERQSH